MIPPTFTISVVSHRHGPLVSALMEDLARDCAASIEVILTLNVPEPLDFSRRDLPFPLKLIRNDAVQGFGANHNAAFRHVRTECFCVVNPDIRLAMNPFPALLDALRVPDIGVAAPLVRDPQGRIEDSARRFPTLGVLLRKLAGASLPLDYAFDAPLVFPDWVAGMFMAFRSEVFATLRGFDEGYFLYYEDVDLCARAWSNRLRIALVTAASVTHDAQRASRRDLRHALWHARSALRYFRKAPRLPLPLV
jgi:N-acetylglucosaminyl-diphospho-decaprenol L-rhamnosyltransferase